MGLGPTSADSPALQWIYQRFFQHIEVDEAWARLLQRVDRGTDAPGCSPVVLVPERDGLVAEQAVRDQRPALE